LILMGVQYVSICIKQHAFSHSRGRGQKYKQLVLSF
jgi:hypothetical protein